MDAGKPAKDSRGSERRTLTVLYPARCGDALRFAADELAGMLTMITHETVAVDASEALPERHLLVFAGPRPSAFLHAPEGTIQDGAGSDGFALRRECGLNGYTEAPLRNPLLLTGGTERAVLHATYELLGRLGVSFPAAGAAGDAVPAVGESLDAVEPFAVMPRFSRRAMVSDIMTWHYETPEKLARHLAYDRNFVTWMAARGLNAFSYIRNRADTSLKIDALVPLYRERGIDAEYGGHVLPLLLPRAHFDRHPDYFPATGDGRRSASGNLCASNRDALSIVRNAALEYVRDNPECKVLHIWGSDVRKGAWCRCAECCLMSPQLQYLKVVNTIAEALGDKGPPVAYLAYHDTLDPDEKLRPLANVWFEWAPRERCYGHSIDDPECETNPRYLDSLRRYLELFEGRGHIFEYYADAILFGGLACATPAVIVRDLRAYSALGLNSISCLTFGMHSALAYPVNLEAYARATRSPDFDPDAMLADVATELHPRCAPAMIEAYRAIAHASALILNRGGDVMHLGLQSTTSRQRLFELRHARAALTRAATAAGQIAASVRSQCGSFELEVWNYSRDLVGGISKYVEAAAEHGHNRGGNGCAAVKSIEDALERLHAIAPEALDTWANWDLEWIREMWLTALRQRFGEI